MNKTIQELSILSLIFLGIFCALLIWLMLKWLKKLKEDAEIVYGEFDLNDLYKIRVWGGIMIASVGLIICVYEIGNRIYNH
jgi:H+/Cl- antiporter ClcA